MIAHVVLFALRADLTPDERQVIARDFERAVSAIPVVRRVRVGKRLIHGAGYEQAAGIDAQYAAIIELDTADDLRAYLAHPAHTAIGRIFQQSFSVARVFDFELAEVDDLTQLA